MSEVTVTVSLTVDPDDWAARRRVRPNGGQSLDSAVRDDLWLWLRDEQLPVAPTRISARVK